MGQWTTPGGQLALPVYRVSDAEWASVPRTVPDWILRWGGYLPYLGLMAWCVVTWSGTRDNGTWRLELPNDSNAMFLGYFFILVLALVAPGAGRVTPWLTFGCVGLLLALGTGDPATTAAAWICAGLLLALGLAGSLSGLRLTLAVRRWRLAAGGPVHVDEDLLRGTRAYRRQAKWLRRAGVVVLMTALYALIKTGVRLFTVAGGDVSRIGEAWDPGALEIAIMPLIGIAFWSTVSAAAWANTRIAGDVVLDVPLDPTIGPLSYARSGLVIPHARALVPGCDCGTDEQRAPDADPVLVPVDESCAVHGITAVNELDARGFLAVAAHPWVWGPNAPQLPLPQGERLLVVGLHGWGSRPGVPGVPVSAKDPENPTHDGYRPWRTVEFNHRGTRRIRWRDEADLAMPEPKEPEVGAEPIDRLRLDAIRLRGGAVRMRGVRPRFEADPGA